MKNQSSDSWARLATALADELFGCQSEVPSGLSWTKYVLYGEYELMQDCLQDRDASDN